MVNRDPTEDRLREACRKRGITLEQLQDNVAKLIKQSPPNKMMAEFQRDYLTRKTALTEAREYAENWINLLDAPKAGQALTDTEFYIEAIIERNWGKDAKVFFFRETRSIVAVHKIYGSLEITKSEDSPCP